MKKFLLSLCFILLLAGCGGSNDDPIDDPVDDPSDNPSNVDDPTINDPSEGEYRVVFYDGFDQVLKEENVEEGGNASAPADPSKEGYIFWGWDTDFINVQSDLDVHPVFYENNVAYYYTLTVYINNEVDTYYEIAEGDSIPAIPVDNQGEATFDGWYLDAGYTIPFDYSTMPSEDVDIYGRFQVTSTVRTDTLGTSWYLGNSNGNLHNGGYGLYDNDRDLHYFVSDKGIYSFDPHTMSQSLLFQSTSTPKSLMINGDQLFFISLENGYLYVLDLTTNQVSVVLEMETLLVARYSGYIYVQYMAESYGSMYLFTHILDDETLEFRTLKTTGATHLNMLSSRLFYTSETNIRLMATGLNGKTTLEDLSSYNLNEIHQLLVVDYDYDAHEFALIATGGSGKGFFVFKDGVLSNVLNGNIASINHNGAVYTILVDGMVKTYDSSTGTLTDLVSVGGDVDSIITINHWYYFIDSDAGTTYQYDPQTKSLSLIQ